MICFQSGRRGDSQLESEYVDWKRMSELLSVKGGLMALVVIVGAR